jgi:2-succinyl-5-enolpyruvyl-6-hydroxy-3-cyclohexene-1-carboxylate synthase
VELAVTEALGFGAAVANAKPTVLLQVISVFCTIVMHYGTITFLKNFKIIVINNGGGGILEFYPGHEESPVLTLLKLHCLTAEHLAKMGFEYTIASDEASLESGLSTLYGQNDKPSL